MLDPASVGGCDGRARPKRTRHRVANRQRQHPVSARRSPGDRPYLEDAPAYAADHRAAARGRAVAPLHQPARAPPGTVERSSLTPPDARRLQLAVTELDVDDAVADDAVKVRGTFAELGWTPCGALLPAVESGHRHGRPGGRRRPVHERRRHRRHRRRRRGARRQRTDGDGRPPGAHRPSRRCPAARRSTAYRIPIPAADFDGVLCTDGVDQPGCTEPEGDAVLGTLVVTATWDEGPVGPAEWQVEPAP